MDVRCERCRAQYVFDDDQVTPAGLTVQCTNCGHLFRVKKKELVVTVAVKPEELDGPPMPATAAAPRAAGAASVLPPTHAEGAREWRVRQASGKVLSFRELTTLQKWIIEQKVSAADEISLSGDGWRRLGEIGELASFFQVVEAAERGRRRPPPAPPVPPAPRVAPPPAPPPVVASPAIASPAGPPPAAPRAARPVPAEEHSIEVELAPEDLAPAGRGRGRRVALVVAPLLVLAGAAAYALGARLLPARSPAPEPVAAPAAAEPAARPSGGGAGAGDGEPAALAAASEPPSAAAAAVAPSPDEPPAAAAPEAAPAAEVPLATPEPPAVPVVPPVPVPEPAPSAPEPIRVAESPPPVPAAKPPPVGPKALVAQAARLRERGEVEKALAIFGRVVETDPMNVAALTGRGLCYLDLERYLPAEASFEAALRVRPDEPDALLGLAESNRWQGKRANAIRYYERYLAAHPAGEEANVARNALEELRK